MHTTPTNIHNATNTHNAIHAMTRIRTHKHIYKKCHHQNEEHTITHTRPITQWHIVNDTTHTHIRWRTHTHTHINKCNDKHTQLHVRWQHTITHTDCHTKWHKHTLTHTLKNKKHENIQTQVHIHTHMHIHTHRHKKHGIQKDTHTSELQTMADKYTQTTKKTDTSILNDKHCPSETWGHTDIEKW